MDDTIFVSGHGSQPEYTLADERCAPTDADAPTPLHDHRGQDAHIKVISSVRPERDLQGSHVDSYMFLITQFLDPDRLRGTGETIFAA
jgi:hypothetical protein